MRQVWLTLLIRNTSKCEHSSRPGAMSCSPLAEAFLCQSAVVSAPLATQNISTTADTAVLAAKLQSSVVLLDTYNLAPQQCFSIPANAGLPSTSSSGSSRSSSSSTASCSIQGVVLSPTGSHVAAYTLTQLLVAAVADTPSKTSLQQQQQQQQQQRSNQAVSQLRCAAVLEGGIRSVRWNDTGTVLAVCSKDKPDVKLFALSDSAAAKAKQQQQQQQQQSCQTGVLTPVSTLPGPDKHSKGSATATWLPCHQDSSSSSSRQAGSDSSPGSSCSTAGLLVSWPNHLLLFTWTVAADGCVDWSGCVTHDILTGWPGAPRALLALQPAPPSTVPVIAGTAAAAAAVGGGCTDSKAGSQQGRQQLVRVVAAVDAAPAWQTTQQQGVSATAAAAAAAVEDGNRAADTDANGVSADVIRPLGLSSGSAGSVNGTTGGVLDSLMNISGQQQQHQTGLAVLQQPPTHGLTPGTTCAAAGSSSTTAAAGSYLCLLTIDLPWLSARRTADDSTAGTTNTPSFKLRQTVAPSQGEGLSAFSSVLPLPQQPLPRFLAAQGSLVAVGSSTGAPCVTLCSVSDSRGLQVLHTVTLPLPKAVSAAAAADGSKDSSSSSSSSSRQTRLQGLLLLPAISGAAAAAGDGSEAVAPNGGTGETMVALLACSDKPSGGGGGFFLGGFGASSSSSGPAVDLHLVKVAVDVDQPGQQLTNSQAPSLAPAAAGEADTEVLTKLAGPQRQQQQQQQSQDHHHHQPAVPQQQQQQQLAAADGSAAVVAALQALQSSLESRLDAMQHTLQRMDQRLQALERKAGA